MRIQQPWQKLATAFFAVVVCPALLSGQASNDVPVDVRPNIILINLDDADSDLLRPAILQSLYPNIRNMAQQGLRFTNMHATTPFCAPSRAALFRGQYAFDTGVKVNDVESVLSNGFTGSYTEFVDRGYDQDELGVWMKNAGYRTMLVGKYHHHNFDNRVPPGWDDFRITLGSRYYGTYRFTNKANPAGDFYQAGENQYTTVVDGNDAVELIQQQSGSDQPYFLYVAPIAPHAAGSFVPEDKVELQYAGFAAGHRLPTSPDLYESDVSDKPKHLRFETPPFWREFNERTYISRIRAIKSVDDLVGRIYAALAENGDANNTYVMLTSDNGFQLGHHNLQNKTDPYHRTSNVPLLVTGPGIAGNQSASHLLAHIDLCPTILNLAQATVPASVTAKSFTPLLFNPQNFPPQDWQEGIMIENWSKKQNYSATIVGSYVAYRQHHEIFVSWANGQFEYYDLNSDPYQLNNRYAMLTTSQKQALKRQVRRFRTREIEPITTLDQIFDSRRQNRNVRLRGYAEDDAGIFGTQIAMKSFTTNRYWNGESWQNGWYGHFVLAKNRNQPMSLWNFKTRVQTETPTGLDYLVFTYRSIDADGVFPHSVNFHVNAIDGKSPIASFPEFVAMPVFDRDLILQGSYYDAVEFDRAVLTIRKTGTNQYFTGSNFQGGRTNLTADLIDDSTWQLNLNLPPGRYVAGIRGIDAAGNRQHPARTLRFRVQ